MTTTATPATSDDHGPVDFVLLELPRDGLTGAAAHALVDVVERGIVRICDLMVISKDPSGGIVVHRSPGSGARGFAYFAGARSGLLGDEHMQEVAAAMRPGTVAALIVYENSWAVPFVAGIRSSGGEVIASARIPATEVAAAVEAMEA